MPSANASAMQILVLVADTQDLPSTASWLVSQLRALLNPHYIVQPVTPQILNREQAWKASCRLVVVPDVGQLMAAPGWGYAMTGTLERYVREGGAFLGIGWGMDVVQSEEDHAEGPSSTEAISATWRMEIPSRDEIDIRLASTALRRTLDIPSGLNSQTLASFDDRVLAASIDLDAGKTIVLSTGLMDSLTAESGNGATVILHDSLKRLGLHPPSAPGNGSRSLASELAGTTTIPGESSKAPISFHSRWKGIDPALLKPSRPLPQILLSKRRNRHPVTNTTSTGADRVISPFCAGELAERQETQSDGSVYIRDVNDTVQVITISEGENSVSTIMSEHRVRAGETKDSQIKPIILPSDSRVQWELEWTPLFDFEMYWSGLDAERRRVGIRVDEAAGSSRSRARLGDEVLYGEAVTSTQTMLDRNPLVLHNLPTPFLSLASFQLSGRGRGTNQWLSPAGCLQFSILTSLPGSFPSNKLVFVQYLMALACCEGLDDDGKLGVRIKWPNDIYAEAEGIGAPHVPPAGQGASSNDSEADRPRSRKGRAKLGGILVNTSFQNNEWRLVIGCGINILNDLPTTSVAQLMELQDARTAGEQRRRRVSMEESLAKILVSFDGLWDRFVVARGFEPFLDEYLGRWLHNEQEVTLTTVVPNIPLRIQSITLDEGLLRCVRLDSRLFHHENFALGQLGQSTAQPRYVDLQPDGNSFDMMAGLIRKKV